MTSRSLTCFSLFCFNLLAVATLHAASVSGTVVLRDSHDEVVVKQRDFSGVVVSAVPVSGDAPATPARHAVMLQKNKTFTPHVLPVTTGATVDFPNADPIFHNAFSSYSGQIFDVGLYPPGGNKSVRFSRPGVVRVFCNIHPTMSAVILVLNTPYFATTAKDGSWELNVPPGDYDVRVFHERSTEKTLAGLSLRIVVADQPVKLPAIAVSEAGYLLAAHKNKYGHDYDSPADDQSLYPAAHK